MEFPTIYRKPILISLAAFIGLGAVAFFDSTLAFALLFTVFLALVTFLLFDLVGIKSRLLFLVFILSLVFHLVVVLTISYTGFQPFSNGRGDYLDYHLEGQEIASRIHQGNFSLEGISTSHSYPMVLGWLYAFTLPEMLIGQVLNAWLMALIVVMVYLMVLELGGSRLSALFTSFVINFYPSLLFFGSLLLREALVTLLAIVALYFSIRLIKKFSFLYFAVFYVTLGLLIHFRFNVGYPLLFTFIPCFIFLSVLSLRKRMVYGLFMIILLGFLPMFSGQGYYGSKPMQAFLNIDVITFYREIAYTSKLDEYNNTLPKESQGGPDKLPWQVSPEDREKQQSEIDVAPRQANVDSTFVVPIRADNPLAFIFNNCITFLYNLLGPFPWQMTKPKHFAALLEVVPWFFLVVLAIWGIVVSFKEKYRTILPILLFGVGTLAIMALFFTNYGIITRIRIPAIVALACLSSLAFNAIEKRNGASL